MGTQKTIDNYSVIPYRKNLWPFLREVKFGRTTQLIEALDKLVQEDSFLEFLPNNPIFVPCPRSSPLKKDTVWPALSISKALSSYIQPSQVEMILERTTAVNKSAFCAPEERPTIQDHFDSIAVGQKKITAPDSNIVLVDDVITKGSTTIACHDRVKDAYPDSSIKVLTLFRHSKGSSTDEDCKYYPCNGRILHYTSGKSFVEHQE